MIQSEDIIAIGLQIHKVAREDEVKINRIYW